MKKLITLISLSLVASPALAHDVSGNGFMAGVMHPVFGIDHILAMVSVDILSTQLGQRGIWSAPLAFICMMVVGGALGIYEFELAPVKIGIALSVLVLGLALAANTRIPLVISMSTVGFSAIFHGHAHGTEMHYVNLPMIYAAGFVTSTAIMHVSGVAIGLTLKRINTGDYIVRIPGSGHSKHKGDTYC